MKSDPSLAHLAGSGTRLEVRVTPRARRNAVSSGDGPAATLRVQVTEAPESGRANEAVRKLLARALGIPKTRLVLIRGETARDKLFRVD